MTTADFLGQLDIFEGLSSDQLTPLAEQLRRRRYERGEVVFHQDDPGDRMHIIVEGRVRISLDSDDGREKDIALLNPGECFGEMALLDGSNRSANATAVDNLETLVLLRDDFQAFLRKHPQITSQMNSMLITRLRSANEMLGDTSFLDVPTRVAKHLLTLAGAVSPGMADPDEAGLIEISIGQEELARVVGASRETVSRALNSYRRMGLLTTSHRRISIKDLKALRRMAA